MPALANDLMVIEGFARASLTPGATTGVAYLKISNRGSEPDLLLAIESPGAAMAELHESKTVDGVATMPGVKAIEIAPGATVEMKPGGLHLMLMGLKAPLKQGSELPLDVKFARAGKISARLLVKSATATEP